MEKFIEELTELSLKHKIIIHGNGTHYCISLDGCKDDLKGRYVICDVEQTKIEWRSIYNGQKRKSAY